MTRLDLTRTDAFLLVGARGDVRIPGIDATAYAMFPKTAQRLRP
jgi:hypothetical protein